MRFYTVIMLSARRIGVQARGMAHLGMQQDSRIAKQESLCCGIVCHVFCHKVSMAKELNAAEEVQVDENQNR